MAKPAEPGKSLDAGGGTGEQDRSRAARQQPPRRLLADQEAAIGADQQRLPDRIGIELGDRAARAPAGVEHRKRQRTGLVGGLEQICDGGWIGDVRLDGQRAGFVDQGGEFPDIAGGQDHTKTILGEKACQRGAKALPRACYHCDVGCHDIFLLANERAAFRSVAPSATRGKKSLAGILAPGGC